MTGRGVYLQQQALTGRTSVPEGLPDKTCRECGTPILPGSPFKKYGVWFYGRNCHPYTESDRVRDELKQSPCPICREGLNQIHGCISDKDAGITYTLLQQFSKRRKTRRGTRHTRKRTSS